ncbi:uncharacterized protein LOC62_07G008946 [Vanrija pseudolonga]|uniref:Uncharacterized protein n=1 Tax=Vanrija pseudolonga TaxID=143232 RepID=A0AAF0YFK6_9TREE|nr:hypothetical protein LOC62_07G008946 [Vanrija pseudolonga]
MSSLLDYPHILDRIVHHFSWSDLDALYIVSKAVHDKISSIKLRQVVFYIDSEESTTIHIRDPYKHGLLLVLDRTDMVQFTTRFPKLKKHTKVLDLAGDLFLLGPWTDLLGEFLAKVPALRALEGSVGLLSPLVRDRPEAKMWTQRAGGPQMAVVIRVPEGHKFGDRNFDVEKGFVYYGIGLKPHELLVMISQYGGDQEHGTPVGNIYSAMSTGGGRYTDVVFIGVDDLYPPPQASDLDRFARNFGNAMNDPDLWKLYRFPEQPNISIKYLSVREYRSQCGLTNEQWDLLMFAPGKGFPLPQEWS